MRVASLPAEIPLASGVWSHSPAAGPCAACSPQIPARQCAAPAVTAHDEGPLPVPRHLSASSPVAETVRARSSLQRHFFVTVVQGLMSTGFNFLTNAGGLSL